MSFTALRAAGLLLCSCLLALPAAGAPLVNVSMVVDGGPNDGASALTVNTGDTVNFRLMAQFAPIGTTNTTADPDVTITSLNDATDGIRSAFLNIYQDAADPIQIDFDAPATLDPDYNGSAVSRPGTVQARGNGFDDLVQVKAVGPAGVFAPNRGASGPVVLATGSFDVGLAIPGSSAYVQLSAVEPGLADSSGIQTQFRINNGGRSVIGFNTDADPYIGFTPLTLTAVPEPASLGLLAVGALAVLRRRSQARVRV